MYSGFATKKSYIFFRLIQNILTTAIFFADTKHKTFNLKSSNPRGIENVKLLNHVFCDTSIDMT